jgi:hypothetical protein
VEAVALEQVDAGLVALEHDPVQLRQVQPIEGDLEQQIEGLEGHALAPHLATEPDPDLGVAGLEVDVGQGGHADQAVLVDRGDRQVEGLADASLLLGQRDELGAVLARVGVR